MESEFQGLSGMDAATAAWMQEEIPVSAGTVCPLSLRERGKRWHRSSRSRQLPLRERNVWTARA
ncbi:hypothetical protein D0N87_16640 [Pseudomonas sp. ATCC 13867]|nr:hypothetical protein D0N87_16640 [Pseudomonas sp. ATCC 13867]